MKANRSKLLDKVVFEKNFLIILYFFPLCGIRTKFSAEQQVKRDDGNLKKEKNKRKAINLF